MASMAEASSAMQRSQAMQRRRSITWSEANRSRSSVSISPSKSLDKKRTATIDISRGVHVGKTLAVFTSGGDSQGMNAAVRAVVRMGLFMGARVFLIREGYQGMVDGGDNIVEAKWAMVSNIIQRGGTVIGSARCKEFMTWEGSLKAARNLVKHSITNIVCIGGDGSLTGAARLKEQWANLLKDLVVRGDITQGQAAQSLHLNIVGIVGSIDNDFCGTDMTIGADSALHRIVEAVDAIQTTADSHRRSFVLEVMGRHCGYLTLVAGIACEADYIFIPESPPNMDWEDKLCSHLRKCRDLGQRLNIILVAEGAQDKEGNAISANMVKDICSNKLGLDTRVTVLGHVQRGGAPSAFDRTLGARMGAEAAIALLEATPETEPCVISLEGNQAVRVPLMDCVRVTKSVQECMDARNFEEATRLRGKTFKNNFETYCKVSGTLSNGCNTSVTNRNQNLAVVHIGAPAGGMNAATRAFVKMALVSGFGVKAVHEGIQGFIDDDIQTMDAAAVHQWNAAGGSLLGCQRDLPSEDHVLAVIAERIKQHNICGLYVIGGFEGFRAVILLEAGREKFPALRIPICLLPATISNNVPGTDFSLGTDTALNEILNCVDKLKQSATGSRRRVFVVETQGAHCGYLATLAGIAGGADQAYIFEEPFRLKDLQDDVDHIKAKIEDGVKRSLILRSERANENYTTDFIERLYNEDGKGYFTAKSCVLGHIQQGGNPSPFDRNMATKLSATVVEWMSELLEQKTPDISDPESCVVIGIVARSKTLTPVSQLIPKTDFGHRLPKEQWWMRLRPLMRILAKHLDTYTAEGQIVEQID